MRRPNIHELQKQCEAFNARYPIGQSVSLRKDGGEVISTVTRSRAEVLSGHSAVIWLSGVTGCYMLNRVTPMVGAEASNG